MDTNSLRLISYVLILSLLSTASAIAGRKVTLGKTIPAVRQVSMDQVDHAAWSRLLQQYVNDRGEVNYLEWQQSDHGRNLLDSYLDLLSHASRTKKAAKESQIAFWVNAYNALTIRGILREYPTTSIRNHTPKLIGFNIWHDLLLNVGGTPISLDSIEHNVLRKLGEPRIHFAIVCASRSCPKLRNQAYTAEDLDQQLNSNAKEFFANRDNFRHDAQRQRFQLSAILNWFSTDFGADLNAQLKTIAPFLPTHAAQVAAINDTVTVSYLPYDWSLNDQDPQTKQRLTDGAE